MIQKRENKLFVQLASSIDEFRFDNMSIGAKIDEFLTANNTVFFEVKSLRHAVILCCDFISAFNLRNSNWTGGLVVDENFNFIAQVSYNGRVWNNTNWEIAKEITI